MPYVRFMARPSSNTIANRAAHKIFEQEDGFTLGPAGVRADRGAEDRAAFAAGTYAWKNIAAGYLSFFDEVLARPRVN